MSDYGYQLQDYVYKYVKDDVGIEFRDAMREWKKHTRTLVQYTRYASDAHLGLLTQIRKEQAASEAALQFALLALSLLAGPALSFVSGALQYRLGPKLFWKQTTPPPQPPKVNPNQVPNHRQITEYVRTIKIPPPPSYNVKQQVKPSAPKPAPKPNYTAPKLQNYPGVDTDWSKTKSKMLGDFGGTLVQEFMVNPAIRAAIPDQSKLRSAITAVPDALSIEGFKTNMDNVWDAAESVGENAMHNFAKMFRDDSGWGERLWTRIVKGEYSNAPRGAGQEWAQVDFGKSMIRDWVHRQREHWAMQSEWFYYGNTPDPISQAGALYALEAEIWALWIMSEDFYMLHTHRSDPEGVTLIDAHEAFGNSGIPLDRVLPRLVQLGLVTADALLEMQKRLVAQATNGPLLPAEIKDIDGKVDTKEELHSLKTWANQRKPDLLGGHYPYKRRVITKEIHKTGN